MFFFFNDTATTEIYTLSLHDALPIWGVGFGDELRQAFELAQVRFRKLRSPDERYDGIRAGMVPGNFQESFGRKTRAGAVFGVVARIQDDLIHDRDAAQSPHGLHKRVH